MNNIKQIIAANISALRQNAGMTQASLAERLNYTDKAVSKWERGESVPDIAVLKQIADMFGVTVDYIINEHEPDEKMPKPAVASERSKKRDHIMITLISITGAWFIALLSFVIVWIVSGKTLPHIFLFFLPVTGILMLVFNSVWGRRGRRRIINYLSITLMIWSTFVIFMVLLHNWQFILLGIPAQLVLTFAIFIKKNGGKQAVADR